MDKYFANFKANSTTSFMQPITGTNKKELIKDIREIAEGERFAGNECSWVVYEKCGNACVKVASGGMGCNGVRWRDDIREIL